MGCQMAITKRDRDPDIRDDNSDDDLKTPNLFSLPDEMLVKIMSFLPGICLVSRSQTLFAQALID